MIENNNSLIMRITLDSWAILSWLQGEPHGALVKNLLNWRSGEATAVELIKPYFKVSDAPPDLSINIINVGEILYIIGRRKGIAEARRVIARLKAIPLEIIPAAEDLVFTAATLKSKYRMAYAEAFAVATAKSRKSILLTGDPELKDLPATEVQVLWIG